VSKTASDNGDPPFWALGRVPRKRLGTNVEEARCKSKERMRRVDWQKQSYGSVG